MSLLDAAMTKCVIMDKTTKPDGQGGTLHTWVDGVEINAAFVFASSVEARIAAKQGVTSLYTVTVPKAVTLDYHDVLRRLSDGKIFRITSNGDDLKTPDSASKLLQVRQYTAEEWVIA